MSDDPKFEAPPCVYEFLDSDEVVRRIKRAKPGTWFWLSVGHFAITKGQVYTKVDGTQLKGYLLSSIIRVSRKQAIKFIEDMYGRGWKERVNVELGTTADALFIGRTPT